MAAMTRTAITFPGQGAQQEGMGAAVAALRPDLHAAACALGGGDPFARAAAASRFAQPAIYAASLAGWSALEESHPDVFTGHSLGEISALAAAGAIDEVDGLRLVVTRGRLMDHAGRSAGASGMVAVLGTRAAELAPQLAATAGAVVANDNAPGQVVLAGLRSSLDTVRELAAEHGLRAVTLPVSGAFHSPLMATAQPGLRRALNAMTIRPPRSPVWSSVHARPFADVREDLVAALTAPVRWRQTVHALHADGVTRFVEVGPGRALTGLVRRIAPGVDVVAADGLVAA